MTDADLTDLTSNNTCASLGSSRGYFLVGEEGEKWVTNVEIFVGYVIANSYIAEGASTDPCEITGDAFLWAFKVECGQGLFTDAGGDSERDLDIGAGLPTDPRVTVGASGDELEPRDHQQAGRRHRQPRDAARRCKPAQRRLLLARDHAVASPARGASERPGILDGSRAHLFLRRSARCAPGDRACGAAHRSCGSLRSLRARRKRGALRCALTGSCGSLRSLRARRSRGWRSCAPTRTARTVRVRVATSQRAYSPLSASRPGRAP